MEGHFCTYKTHIRQDIVNAEVISIVKYALNNEEFKRRIAQRAGGKEDGSLDELMAEKVRLEDTEEEAGNPKKENVGIKSETWMWMMNYMILFLRIIWVLYGN